MSLGEGAATRSVGGRPYVALTGLEPGYETIFRGLRMFFVARGVPAEEAADLAQETVARTLVHVDRNGMTGDSLWPLLRTIAGNLYADRGRRLSVVMTPLGAAVLSIPDESPGPDEIALEAERRAHLHAAIESLAHRHRRVIELSLRGHGPAEIARELGIKRNAADALLHRARRSLATKLESVRSGFGVVGGLPLLRLRASGRRWAGTIARLDPSGAFAGPAAGLASVVVLAALAASPLLGSHNAEPPKPGRTAHKSGAMVRALMSPPEPGTARDIGRPSNTAGQPETTVVADVNAHRLRADPNAQNPTDPDDPNTLSVDVWHDRDPSNRGTVGPALDKATAGVCGDLAVACDAGKQ